MSSFIDNALVKLDEAAFYLALMDKLELERASFTDTRKPEIEFSYLLSALLNACYSCTEHLIRNRVNHDLIKRFRDSHPNFYKSGSDGGWRTQAVHFRPVNPQHDGYIPPPGNNVILRFREKAKPHKPGEPIKLSFGAGSYYFTDTGPQNSICNLCSQHLSYIQKLIRDCK